jgi:RNA polymerase sigma-70 factor (ECF subfamily)
MAATVLALDTLPGTGLSGLRFAWPGAAKIGRVPSEPSPDDAAVARLRAGDASALEELYDRYGRLAYSLAYRITGEAQLAEECAQDTFLQLWRRASDFDVRRGSLPTWLFAIARNRAIELVRRRARTPEPAAEVDPGVDPAADPAEVVAAADESQRLAAAMAGLPAEQLEVLQLAYFDGLSQTEIAERVGVPLGTVKGRVRLALERLRELDLGVEAG